MINSATNEQNEKFKVYISEQKCGWWHWLTNSWLVTDSSGELTAAILRDNVDECFPGVYNLVLELRDKNDTWAGFGTTAKDKEMFKWVKANW